MCSNKMMKLEFFTALFLLAYKEAASCECRSLMWYAKSTYLEREDGFPPPLLPLMREPWSSFT